MQRPQARFLFRNGGEGGALSGSGGSFQSLRGGWASRVQGPPSTSAPALSAASRPLRRRPERLDRGLCPVPAETPAPSATLWGRLRGGCSRETGKGHICRRGAWQRLPLDLEPRGQAGRVHGCSPGTRRPALPADPASPGRPRAPLAPREPHRSLPSGSQIGMAAFDPICS